MSRAVNYDAMAESALLRSLAPGIVEFTFSREFAFYIAGGQRMEPFVGPLAWKDTHQKTPGQMADEIICIHISHQ